MQPRFRRRWWQALLLLLGALVAWLLVTDNSRIWPYRNTIQYYVFRASQRFIRWEPTMSGILVGSVRDTSGTPISNARVLVSAWNGTTWSGATDVTGHYRITDVPAGSHVVVAGAAGYEDWSTREALLNRVRIRANMATELAIELAPAVPQERLPAANWRLGPPRRVQTAAPLPATADEYEVRFDVDGRPNQTTLYYTPVGGPPTLPTLLAVYPGPADTWASVSLPLAQAGYAVIAVGPAYALDLEADVDDLVRVLTKVHEGAFPRADPERIGLLGGSYSSLHVFRLAERNPDVADGILVLGPPSDLFELRRLFENGTFFPPFRLDEVFIAFGLPSDQPERYFRYSPRFHASAFHAPIMLIHSKVDEVVPFRQSQLLAEELARLGKPHELKILEGMGHYLLEPERTPAIDDLFNTTLSFFERELRRPE